MSAPETFAGLAAAANLLLWPMAAPAATVQPEVNPAPPPPKFKAELKTQMQPGLGPIQFAYVTAGTNLFAFSVPKGFQMGAPAQSRVSLANSDYSCLLSVQLADWSAQGGRGLTPSQARELLLAEHPDARVLQEFTLSAAGRSGPAFDLQWSQGAGLQRQQRIAFIPSTAGVLEFSEVSGANALQKGHSGLNYLLLTFRARDAEGKLELPRFSNKF